MPNFKLEVYKKRKSKERIGDRWCDVCGHEIPKDFEFWFVYTNCQKPILSACKECADTIEVNT